MAKVRSDRVKEVSLTQGTGDFVLVGTGTGFVTFSTECASGDTLIILLLTQVQQNGKQE